jgi:uracil-DNA glycosylase
MEVLVKKINELDPAYRDILIGGPRLDILRQALLEVVADVCGDYDVISPPIENIFAAFELCPFDSIKCIIMGQDPYPDRASACGLSFAIGDDGRPSASVPASLKNILKALGKTATSVATAADLRAWPAQGILMTNMTLTTRAGKSNVHRTIWAQYSHHMYNELFRAVYHPDCINERPVYTLLWGAAATTFVRSLALPAWAAASILTWGHPSPLNADNKRNGPKHFENCDHFAIVSKTWPEIEWSTSAVPGPALDSFDANAIYIGTDGSCRKNGTKHASRAAWAIVIYRPVLNTFEGFSNILKAQPTNQRAELMAIIEALKYIQADCLQASSTISEGSIETVGLALSTYIIVSDSLYSINCITVWGPDWLRAGSFEGHCNTDLIREAMNLLTSCRAKSTIIFKHVRGHRVDPGPGHGDTKFHTSDTSVKSSDTAGSGNELPFAGSAGLVRLYWTLNNKADELCTAATKHA